MHPEWWAARLRVESPGRPGPWVTRLLRAALPVVRLAHRAELHGVEHLPASGPYLLVANHSAGTATAEVISFAALYLKQVGADRPLAGFAHPGGFYIWPASAFLKAVGAIPSTRAAAEATLAAG